MNVYMTEDEQIELIKKWWNKYGNTILTAIIIVALLISAYRWWNQHQTKVETQASNSYELMMQSVANHDDSDVQAQANNILQNFPHTVYAQVAALAQARQAVYQGNLDLALQKLNWVIDHAKTPALKQVARVRAARIKMSQRDYAAALAFLATVEDNDYLTLIYETRGDVNLAAGKVADARKNYTLAVNAISEPSKASPILQMKLNDLAQ